MPKSQNPLRLVAETQLGVDGGTSNLVANGIYSVEDVILPLVSQPGLQGDARLFVGSGQRQQSIRWRRVNGHGWIGPKHKAADDKDTVLQIKFARPRKFNYLSFDLLRVPQEFVVKYYDSSRKKMVKLSDTKGRMVEGSFDGNRQTIAQPGRTGEPAKKWRNFSFDLPKVRTNLIEIHLNRDTPLDGDRQIELFGLPQDTPYSLGIRNLKIKYKQRDDEDDDDGTPGIPGTNERPLIVRHSPLNAHDGQETTYWECAPQGAASSVVPFYVDLRQSDGTEAVLDTIKLVPLWPGPSMSLYYSSDEVTTPWESSSNRVDLDSDGDENPTFVKDSGVLVDASDESYVVSNDLVRTDLSRDFVLGLQWTPTFTNSGTDRWLWAFENAGATESLALKFDPTASAAGTITGEFKIIENGGGSPLFTSASHVLTKDTAYGVVLGYNHVDRNTTFPRGWYLAVSPMPGTNATITEEFSVGTPPADLFPATLRLGNNDALNRPVQGYLSGVWLREDTYTSTPARTYLTNATTFIRGDGDPTTPNNGLYKALLVAALTSNIEARVGPGAGYFRNKEWTPIPLNYTLGTTFYEFPIVSAKYLKLEFSNLAGRTYFTDETELPVTDFPTWVKDWFKDTIGAPRQGVPYQSARQRSWFENPPTNLSIPGDRNKYPAVKDYLDGGGGSGLPPVIFHRDQGTTDMLTNPGNFDRVGTYKELQFATLPFHFFRKSRHTYDYHTVQVERRAFFVGIKELAVFRTAHTVQMDSREYAETYDDDVYIQVNDGFINVGGSMSAGAAGDSILSEDFESFSNFKTAQMAVLDSGWQSMMSQAEIDLGSLTHLKDTAGTAFASSTQATISTVTGQYQGARGGNVIKVVQGSDAGAYGVLTESGIFDGSNPITADNSRVSAVARIQLPVTNDGRYELRLYAFDGELSQQRRLVASKPIRIPTRAWKEIELVHVALDGELDWQAEIVQLDPGTAEPFLVDMLGIWQNPVKWEVSNDGGTTWQIVAAPLNKPTGYIGFKEDSATLKVRVTALKTGAVVSGWTVVPWYTESPMVMRAPIDVNPPWAESDDESLRDTSHKPMFRIWNHYFPQRYSTDLLGLSAQSLL